MLFAEALPLWIAKYEPPIGCEDGQALLHRFQKGFIKAEVVSYDDLVAYSQGAATASGIPLVTLALDGVGSSHESGILEWAGGPLPLSVVEEAAALASISLFLGMLAVWIQVFSAL